MVSKACVVGEYQRKLEELAALEGMELLVIVPPYWQEESRRIPLERLHTRGYRLEVEPIRFNPRAPTFVSKWSIPASLATTCHRAQFHIFHFPGLAGQVRSFRPDLIHVDEEPYNLAGWQAVRLAKASGARSLFFTWQNLYRRYPPPFRWMEQYCFRVVDSAIAGNVEAANVLRHKGFRQPVAVIPQFGVDPEIFRPADLSPGPDPSPGPSPTGGGERGPSPLPCAGRGARGVRSPFEIGYVGRLVEQKGVLDLVEAVGRLKGERKLTLIGAGPLQTAVEARAAELGISSRLEVLAGVPSSRMPELYRRLDVLVLPSRTRPNWKEQFGRALVEAMACRVPVVGADSGEIPNVIGDAGLIFSEGDVDALVAHLERLRDSSELRWELGERGRARVLERFTQASVARQTYEVYRSIMAEHKSL